MSVAYGDDDFLSDIPIEDLAAAAADTGIDLNSRAGDDPMAGAKIARWRDMPDTERSAAWDQLRGFVDWLATRYDLQENIIPPCWYRHGALVEELSALRAAWDASFTVETDGGLGPLGWHERFALAKHRLSDAYRGGCTRRGHDDRPPITLAVDEDAWSEWRARA